MSKGTLPLEATPLPTCADQTLSQQVSLPAAPVTTLDRDDSRLSAISTREMTKIGIGWLIGSQDAIGTLKYLSVREDSYQSRRLISKNPLFRKDFVSFNQRGVNCLLKPLSDITTPALLGLHRHRVIAPVVHFVPPGRQHIG